MSQEQTPNTTEEQKQTTDTQTKPNNKPTNENGRSTDEVQNKNPNNGIEKEVDDEGGDFDLRMLVAKAQGAKIFYARQVKEQIEWVNTPNKATLFDGDAPVNELKGKLPTGRYLAIPSFEVVEN